jgi:3-oxoacyl-[acyl-carrier protein] reductase
MVDYGLLGKTAAVTGAGSGIGESAAKMLAEQGCRVALIGRRYDALISVKNSILAAGGEAEAFPCDVGNEPLVRKMAAAVLKRFGTVDILANVAGVEVDFGKTDGMEPKGFGDPFSIPPDEWNKVMNTNVRGHFNTMKYFSAGMRQNRFGRIVNVTSATAFNVPVGSAAYVGSKAAANTMTYLFAKKLGPDGITVNAVAPGYVETPMQDGTAEESKERIAQSTPLRRICQPDDVARVILFFAQKDLFVSGQVLIADGGAFPR